MEIEIDTQIRRQTYGYSCRDRRTEERGIRRQTDGQMIEDRMQGQIHAGK